MTAVAAPSGSAFSLARSARGVLRRVPVWSWRLLMLTVSSREQTRFNMDPVSEVTYTDDVDYFGDGLRAHRLDVLTPPATGPLGPAGAEELLPVYVYFHGGGWTSGDKAAVTKYCANQALGGMVVVNVNYRRAPRFHMGHLLEDANIALAWVGANIRKYGGDPERLVLGGDSAGGQIAALLTAASLRPELAAHYALQPALPGKHLKGLVQHCSAVDFSVFFDRGFVLSLNFIRMLLPSGLHPTERTQKPLPAPEAAERLKSAAGFMSPIEWLDDSHPPVFVTTSERDFFYQANLNFIERLQKHRIPVDALIYRWDSANTEHTWQQDYRYPESQEVYRRLHAFVRSAARASSAEAPH
ncbi:acetyl esterase/lipase [Arthrobacter sp. SLBN-100]|uniref:alpha/beta hydrolase n=1 Tax=Arthrobacter sp. SLBN-100 TaxID=2768450 RepID=UPI00116E1406|nr:alpha/beta hydrolase [Arthrobacter sp. SLBN-100]TQJ66363.1 acetyl esterase/lipase [Arthrobacter sp. SLBN-100]